MSNKGAEMTAWMIFVGLGIGLVTVCLASTWLGLAKAAAWLAFWTFTAHETEPPRPDREPRT